MKDHELTEVPKARSIAPEFSELDDDLLDVLRRHFDAGYYLENYPDIAASGYEPLEHYLRFGWREGRKFGPGLGIDIEDPQPASGGPTPARRFLRLLQTLRRARHPAPPEWNEERHRLREWLVATAPQPIPEAEPARPALDPGVLAQVGAAFDADWYLKTYPDVAEAGKDPLLHYLNSGWKEDRDPCPGFSTRFYLRHAHDIRSQGVNPFVHYVRHGKAERRPSASAAQGKILLAMETDPVWRARIDAAVALEPMVALPETVRLATTVRDHLHGRIEQARHLRETFAGMRYSHVILLPHMRMSGAGRVASILARALVQMRGAENLLIVTTDGRQDEYAHWFPAEVRQFNLWPAIETLQREGRIELLLDLLGGIGCTSIFNVNSRLMWEALGLFGRNIRQRFKVASYLFTWDLSRKGNRVGYPIQWLRDTVDFHHLILTDTESLAGEIRARFGFDTADDAATVIALKTPVDAVDGPTPRAARPDPAEPAARPRFLWAGRFDRQKRVDLLRDIARTHPEFDFDVYGKPVIGDESGVAGLENLPNLVLKGTYTDLQQVLDTPYHAFLYTAQWDGLPTILLDMAQAGLPIVAPNVGGIGAFIRPETGWLVDRFDDVAGFGAALANIVARPDLAQSRVAALQQVIAADYTAQTYALALDKALTRHDM